LKAIDFSEFYEDTVSIEQHLEQATKVNHEIGLHCRDYHQRDRLLNEASILISMWGRVVGHVWDDDKNCKN
jgi:hypothetical protein